MEECQGWLPTYENEPPWYEYRINFALGAPGAIPLLTTAAEVFTDMSDRLLILARRIGDRIWDNGGIRIERRGLTYGTAGNGYILLNLHRSFKKRGLDKEAEKWKTRALYFAKSIADKKV
jgi:hypothetical protein